MKNTKKILLSIALLMGCGLSYAINNNLSELGQTIVEVGSNPDKVEQLIVNGANVNEKQSQYEATPLILLAMNIHTNPEQQERVAKLLLDAGADLNATAKGTVNAPELEGKTALDIARRWNQNRCN